ncbi:MAG: hypothetical protein EOP48_18930 [Sphingobacteriales bacterium]|nr:MAG: hypothetical protein EOP48_18930 [Sphingobacteriales bacterium]
MLKAHIDAIEDILVAKSRVPANAGHSLHKGTPREAFIAEFLKDQLPENFAIGSGEIIDCNSRPHELRNQHDIIIYRKNFPKLRFGADINAYLVESVIATIEVKSTLTKDGVFQAVQSAHRVKNLSESWDLSSIPYLAEDENRSTPAHIKNYVIAYDGPGDITKVHHWISSAHKKLKIPNISLPLGRSAKQAVQGNTIDAIFILKKGFISFANRSTYYQGQIASDDAGEYHSWVMANQGDGNLIELFMELVDLSNDSRPQLFYPMGYLKHHQMGEIYMCP